nr:reverse transcriptase domain-containing protein [Tanacetum cinerariifolium]
MRTRNSYFSNNSSATILRRQNKRRNPNVVEPELRTIVEMADNRTMEELLQAPTEGFTELAQIDTFYNGLNDNDQDSFNAAAGGNLLSKTTREALQIIENKLKVLYSRNKPNVSRMKTTSRENAIKAVEESCVTFGGAHAYYNFPNTDSSQPSVLWRRVVEQETEETTDKEQTNFQGSTTHIQPPVTPFPKPDVSKTLPKPNIPYPSRLNDQKLREKAMNEMEKFFQIFQDSHFDISFVDALLLMLKFASTIIK